MKSKKQSTAVRIMETTSGFSIVEGNELLNKDSEKVAAQQNPQMLQLLNSINSSKKQAHSTNSAVIKESRNVYQKVQLMFPRLRLKDERQNSPKDNVAGEAVSHNQNSLKEQIQKGLPSESKHSLEWFSLEKVAEKQKSELRAWWSQEYPNRPYEVVLENLEEASNKSAVEETAEFKRYLERYRTHRNIIIRLYYQNFHELHECLTCSEVRKHISADAYWLMKIHTFLTNNLVINCGSAKNDTQAMPNEYIYKFNLEKGVFEMLPFQYDFRTEKQKAPDSSESQNRLLKEITSKIRPYCDHCGVHCGIVWFQHSKQMDSKEIAMIMKNVNSKKKPLSNEPYELILCTRCYCDGNFPLLLTHHDFKKTTINDRLEPNNKKKKIRRNKKSKKKKRIERERRRINREQQQMEEEQQQGEQQYEGEDEAIFEEHENQSKGKEEDNPEFKSSAEQKAPNESQQKIEQSEVIAEQQPEAPSVSANIESILADLAVKKSWSMEETLKVLQLIETHRENWSLIKQELNRLGLCKQTSVCQLIQFFIELPIRGVTKVREEYSIEQFLLENHKVDRSKMSDKMAERTLNRCVKLSKKMQQSPEQFPSIKPEEWNWKRSLDQMLELEQKKIENRLQYMVELEALSKEVKRKFYRVVNEGQASVC